MDDDLPLLDLFISMIYEAEFQTYRARLVGGQ
jgi:hypothetical protein